MSALSTHLIEAYTGYITRAAFPPFKSQSQTTNNPPDVVSSGPMSYNPNMHGSFNAVPQFSQQPGQFGGASGGLPSYNANMPQQPSAYMDLSDETARKIATLQSKLDKKLGPEYISQRPGPGGAGKLTYAEGWKIINLANEVFGFNGWSSSITSLSVDYVRILCVATTSGWLMFRCWFAQIDYNEQTQRYCVGVTAIVKVVLRDGVYHEDVGFGMLDNCKQKGMAIDKVRVFRGLATSVCS